MILLSKSFEFPNRAPLATASGSILRTAQHEIDQAAHKTAGSAERDKSHWLHLAASEDHCGPDIIDHARRKTLVVLPA
jgi:hypothetical protein